VTDLNLDRAAEASPGQRKTLRNIAATGRVYFWQSASLWIGKGQGRSEWHSHHAHQLALLFGGEFRLLAAQLALGASDRHALAGAHAQQVDLELGEGSQDVEEHFSHRVGRVVDLPAEGEPDAAGGQRIADLPGIRHRAGQPVEFRNHEGVALSHSGEGLAEAGPFPVGPGKSVIEVDPLLGDAEFSQAQRHLRRLSKVACLETDD